MWQDSPSPPPFSRGSATSVALSLMHCSMNISVQFNVAVALSREPPLQFVNTRPASRSSKSQEEERKRAGVSDGLK